LQFPTLLQPYCLPVRGRYVDANPGYCHSLFPIRGSPGIFIRAFHIQAFMNSDVNANLRMIPLLSDASSGGAQRTIAL